MTNKEAISVLESINAKTDYFLINDDARAEAIDMAISALQAQDVPDINVGDMISRQKAIDALMDEFKRVPTNAIRAKDALEKLSSAQPEQTEMIKEIRKWINSANRGNADYFIVDKIEEIINRYE